MRKILLLPLGVLLGPWTFCYAQEQKQSNTEATVETGVPETRAADGRAPILFSNYNRTDPGQEEYYAVEGLAVNTPKISGKIYGGNQPDLYTGTVSATIPVYTYKDPDFTLPISLYYSSNGYQPNITSDGLGVGWAVSGGGYIAQEVRGIPDYVIGVRLRNRNNGYSRIAENLTNKSLQLSENNLNDQCGYYTYEIWSDREVRTEMEPDIYHFNFMGYSGSFIQTGDTFHVFNTNNPHGEYSIEILPNVMYYGSDFNYTMTMRITTGDGYVYVFRNDRNLWSWDKWGGAFWPAIIFNYGNPTEYWMLSEVYAPNGRKMSFEYVAGVSGTFNTNNAEDIDYASSVKIPRTEFHSNRNPKPALKKITIDDVEIVFNYKTRPSDKYAKYIHYDETNDTLMLRNAGSNQYLSSIRVSKPAKSMQLGAPSATVADNGIINQVANLAPGEYLYEKGEFHKMN